MEDSFEFINKFEPIDITKLLLEMDLPIGVINILKENTFYSEENFFKTVDKLRLEHTSNYLFPNRLMSFYPQIKERHATNDLILTYLVLE